MHKCYVPKSHVLTHIFKVGKKALTQDTVWESDKYTRKHHTQESQDVSPFPA